MKTRLWAVAAAIFALTGAACSSSDAPPLCQPDPVHLDVTALGATQVYKVTLGSGATYHQTFEVVAGCGASFTRLGRSSNGAGDLESVYDVVNGGEYLHSSGASGSASVYTPSGVILPADVTPGAHVITTSAVTNPSYTATRDAGVVGVESVTVPAGTYLALKVSTLVHTSTTTSTTTNDVWWADGIGRVKILNSYSYGGSTMWELESFSATPLPPPGSLDGTYATTAIKCNGTAAPSPIAGLITGGHTMTFTVSGTAGSTIWSDGACTITQPNAYAFPSAGNLTRSVAGAFSCSPSSTACAAFSAATFNPPVNVCGQTDLSPSAQYTYAPSSVAVGGTVTLTRVGGTECASAAATDPISYALTKQ